MIAFIRYWLDTWKRQREIDAMLRPYERMLARRRKKRWWKI